MSTKAVKDEDVRRELVDTERRLAMWQSVFCAAITGLLMRQPQLKLDCIVEEAEEIADDALVVTIERGMWGVYS